MSFGFGYETNIAGIDEPLNFHVFKKSEISILSQIKDRKSYFAIPDFTNMADIFSTFSQDARNYSTHLMVRRLGVRYSLTIDSSQEK